MSKVKTTQIFSYRQSLLANKTRVAILKIEDAKQANYHKKKRRLYLSQKGRCCFCNVKTYLDSAHSPKNLLATFEHMTPRCKGGSSTQSNLKISCFLCNKRKGELTAESFRERLQLIAIMSQTDGKVTGKKAKKRDRRTYIQIQEAYHILDGGEHNPAHRQKLTKQMVSSQRRHNEFMFNGAMNELDVTRWRMGY